MPFQKIQFIKDHYYHLYNRGINRAPIFFCRDNYLYCLRLINKYRELYHISIIAYCLMPNHYHLLIRQDGIESVSVFMQQTFKAYVQALNKQQHRVGGLFQNRFRAIVVDDPDYLVYLCRYVHRNPVKAGMVTRPDEWEFSNYRDWIGERRGTLLDRNFIDAMYPDIQEYVAFAGENDSERIEIKLAKYYLD